MKKTVKRTLAVLLVIAMLVICFTGCSSQGKTLMKLEDTKISVNLYMLYLSRMKGILCSSYSFGADALEDSFWDTVMSADGTTYNQYYSESVLDNVKTYLAALYEFEQRGLKLPDETMDEIDARIDELIENDANGSKTTFNSILAEYGANYKNLREAFIIEEKIAYLKDDIYGAQGEKIAKNLVDDYYEQNYARFKQVFFYTYDYLYYTDGDGQDIYYKADGKIAYDTSATPKVDQDGNEVLDSNGDRIYVTVEEDGTQKVAYDKINGTRRNQTDSEGNKILADLTGEKLKAVETAAKLVYDSTATGDFSGFDELLSKDEKYPNGIYLTRDTDYDAPEVVEAVFEMEIGEVRTIKSDYGVHIVMRYELEEDGYNKTSNSDFFISTTTGNYVFMNDIKNQLLAEKLKNYKQNIIIDEAALEGVDMKSVGANFYY